MSVAHFQPSLPTLHVDDRDLRFQLAKSQAKILAETQVEDDRLAFARSFCFEMLNSYWVEKCLRSGITWSILGFSEVEPLADVAHTVASTLGAIAGTYDCVNAGHLLSTVYTCLLPSDLRSRWGSFYTPPQYVDRLLDLSESSGFEWSTGSAVDPACGGAAFLSPMALRMWKTSEYAAASDVLDDVCSRIAGYELDPFAAWMSHVLLEVTLLPLCVQANRRMPNLIKVGDSLLIEGSAQFDLVVGNPPFGRITLAEDIRQKFARSLYGHANLYGLFTDLAVRMCKPGGVIALVSPTSFLGGQYFKALRKLLLDEAPPLAIDFIEDRTGVFDDVLQEALLAVYGKGRIFDKVSVCSIDVCEKGRLQVTKVLTHRLTNSIGPWVIPRGVAHGLATEALSMMTARLSDYGYSVSTGPLVWNRHKHQLRFVRDEQTLPLIWAESVSLSGFSFSSGKRNHAPYFALGRNQAHLVLSEESVLVQRTTSKEQVRRLICAVIDGRFLRENHGAVVENHLNVLKPSVKSIIRPRTIARVLNSRAVDSAFRCISGSVAVSAYELNALPMPPEAEMLAIQGLIDAGAPDDLIEQRLCCAYGVH